MLETTILGSELLGPLLETSLVGGLTAVAIAYEHFKTSSEEKNIHPILKDAKPEKNPRFMIPAMIFFVNEFILLFGYLICSLFKLSSIASIVIYFSCILFLIGITLLIRDTRPVFSYMNYLKQIKQGLPEAPKEEVV